MFALECIARRDALGAMQLKPLIIGPNFGWSFGLSWVRFVDVGVGVGVEYEHESMKKE